MVRVKNEIVWKQIRTLFLASAILFLANIFLGFDNALTAGALPRWQALVHVHAGTLGWVTLSVVGVAIWIHTGQRQVTASYERTVTNLARYGIGIFAGYIISFGLAFAFGGPFFALLPIFGISASLFIWLAALFIFRQGRQQPVLTTVHVMITTALLVAALASTIGVLLGLEYLIGFFVPGPERIGVHAAPMDAYLLLAAAAMVEWFLRKDPEQHWTWAGIVPAVAWGLSALLFILGNLLTAMPLVMLFAPLLFLGLIFYVARIGWRGFLVNPLGKGARSWVFFGNIWAIFWGSFFIWVIANFLEDFESAPSWVAVIFAHSAFVGMMTNLLLAVYSARSRQAGGIWTWAEPAAMWLINLGLLLFFGLKIASDSRLGALVMGLGVLLGVLTMILRLRAVGREEMPEAVVAGTD